MHILYIVPYVPTPIRVRPYNLIRALVQSGQTVTLATVWERAEELQALEQLRAEGIRVIAAPLTRARRIWNNVRAMPTTQPLQAMYCDSPALRRQIEAACNSQNSKFDVVHVEHLRGAAYGLWCKSRMQLCTNEQMADSRIPVIWDSVDCITYLFEQAVRHSQSLFGRLVTRMELGRTRNHERWLAGQFDHMLVTSNADKRAFQDLTDRTAPITVLPNGVNLDYFHPEESIRLPGTIVFSGKMSYHANTTAALYLANEIMPLIWAERPDARLIIAGSRPPQAVSRLAIVHPERVVVTGYLPELRLPLQQASVAVAPLLYGAGIQNKVLEAMACATPVVATTRAVAALSVRPGTNCLVADTAVSFSSAVLQLLRDNELRARLGTAGRCYVETNHDWHQVVTTLEAVYRALIHQHEISHPLPTPPSP